jgi:hypothetical protein
MRPPYKITIPYRIRNKKQALKSGISIGSFLEIKIKEVDARTQEPIESKTRFYGNVAEIRDSSLIILSGWRGIGWLGHPVYGFVPKKSSTTEPEKSRGNEVKYSAIERIAIVKGITRIPEYESPNPHVHVN